MSKLTAIARRELKSYFDSPVAYIVIGTFLLIAGWMVFSTLFLSGQAGLSGRADMRTFFTPSLFSPAALFVILAPAITMRLVAEERKSGTFELLTTMPVSDLEVVLGKFLAAVILTTIALAMTVVYAISVSAIGPLDWGPVVSGYLGMLLFAAALLAIGLMCSALSSNQIVAFIVAFFISGALFLIHWLQFFLPDWLAPFVGTISISSHLGNMARGVIDSRDVIYYLSVMAGALFLAERALARQHA